MMPLAFDLISTLVIGSILPVATTDLVIVPRSTVAIEAGIEVGAGAGRPGQEVDAGHQTDSGDRAPENRRRFAFLPMDVSCRRLDGDRSDVLAVRPDGRCYNAGEMTVGILRETFPGERRVAVIPAGVATLKKAGIDGGRRARRRRRGRLPR